MKYCSIAFLLSSKSVPVVSLPLGDWLMKCSMSAVIAFAVVRDLLPPQDLAGIV